METDEVKINASEIIIRLAKLQADMNYLKEHIDEAAMTEDDWVSVEEAKEDLKKGKTRRL